jgi:FdhE protein
VASNFIRKLLVRAPALPLEVVEAQAELALLMDEKPVLAELAGQLREFLSVIYAEPVQAAAPSITAETATEKLSAGVPLLRGETLDVGQAVQRRLQKLAAAQARQQPGAAQELDKVIRAGELDTGELTAAVLDGQPHRIHECAGALGLDAPLTASLLALALYPELVAIRAGLEAAVVWSPDQAIGVERPGHRATAPWGQGYCPVCGSFPRLGEYRGLEQIRFLRCGLCAAEWQFPRLRCPGCGNRDHRQLGYLHVAGEENKCRSATCEACRQYVKMVSTLGKLSPVQVLVTDVTTVHLDLLAADKGYSPPM